MGAAQLPNLRSALAPFLATPLGRFLTVIYTLYSVVYDAQKYHAFAMSTLDLLRIVGRATKDYFQQLGKFYKNEKTKFEAIKLAKMADATFPTVPAGSKTKTFSAVEWVILPITRPFYAVFFLCTKMYFLNAPFWAGGYQGIDLIDVCASMTGISTKHLVFLGDMCDERIHHEIHGYTVFLITVLVTVGFLKGAPLLKYLVDRWYDQRNKDREAVLEMENHKAQAFHCLMNDRKKREAALKGRWTKTRHQEALSSLSRIAGIVDGRVAGTAKLENIQGVVHTFRPYTEAAPPPWFVAQWNTDKETLLLDEGYYSTGTESVSEKKRGKR